MCMNENQKNCTKVQMIMIFHLIFVDFFASLCSICTAFNSSIFYRKRASYICEIQARFHRKLNDNNSILYVYCIKYDTTPQFSDYLTLFTGR